MRCEISVSLSLFMVGCSKKGRSLVFFFCDLLHKVFETFHELVNTAVFFSDLSFS